MEFHSRIKYLLYHSNSQGCATKAVASVPHLPVPNNHPWEPVRGKWLGRLGKASEPVTWGFCLTAADRAGAALGNLPLADDFNEEKNAAPSQYFLNFRSESTRYSFYQDIVFSSLELHADEVFNTLSLIKDWFTNTFYLSNSETMKHSWAALLPESHLMYTEILSKDLSEYVVRDRTQCTEQNWLTD